MKVCIDIQSVITSPAGVGRYTRELTKAMSLLPLPDGMQVTLSFFDFKRRYAGGLLGSQRFTEKAVRVIPGAVYNCFWKRFHWPPLNWLWGNYDLYHFPNFILPPLPRGKKIITVHDIAFVHYPQYIEPKNLSFLRMFLPRSLQEADKIIAVSNFTKQELIRCFRVPEEKIVVIYEGVAENFRRVIAEEVRSRYRLPARYILFLGTLEPRKNLIGLLEAFASGEVTGCQLVVAGGKGWFYQGIYEKVKQLGLENKVVFLGYIPEADLPALYSMAEVFVYLSFYEGFGLPPLEAMACGVPVVSSSAAALPEVLGEAAVLAEIGEPQGIAAGIREALHNKENYVAKGYQQAGKYSWKQAAEKTLKLYQSFLNESNY